ncbi:hypothetical protein ABMA57_06070 [Saccharospirillum sp. HFRX-1]|uniref:hypothetical protein n=1 Tax=unclassified Saccharospirillum TaxID=2633430 RepID=UPI00371AC437
MIYFLQPIINNNNNYKITIDAERYSDLVNSKNCLLEAIQLEEKMRCLLENYKEYESYLLRSALTNLIGEVRDFHDFQNKRSEVNRHIFNFMATARAYLDHGDHHIKKLLGVGNDAFFSKEKSKQYDASFAYRVMEALRNYTQHRGFPIHMISFKHSREELDVDNPGVGVTISPKMSVNEFLRDPKFKRAVANEMMNHGDAISLTPLVRDYVSQLTSIHRIVQEYTEGVVGLACKKIEEALSQVKKIFELDSINPGIYVTAERYDHEQAQEEEFTLIPEFEVRYRLLKAANKEINNLRYRYVTGRASS